MNKVKMFFVAAALVLTTAGVFAGKAKFQSGTLVAYNGTTVAQLAPSITSGAFLTSGSTPASIIDNGNHAYGVYSLSGSTYTRLYSNPLAW